MQAYLLKTVKRLKKEASWRSSDLKKLCVELITALGDDPNAKEGVNTDEIDHNVEKGPPVVFDSADPYMHIFKVACESRQSKLIDIALDAIHYFIEHDFLKGKGIVDEENGLTLMDDIIETVCKCEDEFDEVIQLQKIKVLLTAVTSNKVEVHGSSLLLSLRSCFHIHLISKNIANKTTAKAALTQMLDIINQRMELETITSKPSVDDLSRAGLIESSSPSMKEEVCKISEEVISFPDESSSTPDIKADTTNGGSVSIEKRRVSKRPEQATVEGVTFSSIFHRDSFLVFRALCRLSNKGLHDDNDESVATDIIALKNKLLSLELILHVLKRCGSHFVSSENMLYIIRTYLCVSLLSNCTSHEVQVVSLSLQVFLGLFENFKGHLKSELEIFVTTIFLRILESENSSTDHKMRVLEVFLNICRDHILLVEIFVNYDCDFEAIDLFKRIVDGFAKIAKHNPTKLTNELSNLRIMGLEGLVVVLRSLLNSSYFGQVGIDDLMKPLSPDLSKSSAIMPKTYDTGKPIKSPSLSALADDEAGGNVDDIVVNSSVFSSDAVEKFDKKKRIHEEIETGILKFNLSPKKGLAYLVSLGHLEMTAKSVAHFFRQYQDRLDKTVVGEYLGREREYEQGFCIKVLNEYVDSMEFTSMKFDEAIRFFLSGFRLPGEAQKIDRLMEKFAERFYLQNRQDFASADMAFILAFSTIMLQTNLHNPAIKDDKRMTKEQFIKQNKGITPDGELSDELLSEIYDRISLHPISLNKDDAIKQRKIDDAGTLRSLLSSADTKRKEAFSDERREMVKAGEAMFKQKSKLGNTFVHTSKESDEEYVRPMFEVSWAPMIGVFSQILETSESTKQIELCIIGLSYGTRLAGRLDFSIVRHTYMNALAKFTSMESTREVNGKNIECIKALIAVARTEGEYLSESWVDVMRCVSQLDRLAGLVHNMRSEDGSSTASASSAASKKNLSRTADKDTFSKLFLGVSKADSMRIIDESNAELLEDAVDSEDVDHIFLNSRCLSGEAIFVFVQSLCAVSLQEINAPIPRVFLLQKLVEVADFNMGSRPRLDWDRIWNLLASHFTIVGTHKNLQLAMYAVDSLKQLSIKFLQKVELANFNFQRKFLKPFEIILGKTQSFQIKDLVIRCLDIMIQACAINIRSGWRSIFAIFEIAAASEKYEVSALAFEVTERLIKNQFDLLIYDFVELMNCLVAFVSGPHSLLSLSAITHVSTCAFHLANGDVSPALDNQHNFSDPLNISWEKSSHRVEEEAIGEDTSVFRLWWPLLLGLSTRASDPRNEIREQALHSLHKILSMYGHLFSSQTWSVIFKGVLFPMIDSVLTDNSVYVSSTYPSQHPELTDSQRTRNSMGYQVLSVCLSLFHSNRYKAANDVYNLLPELLTLLEDCVCQDSESLSSIGAKALYDFIDGFRSSTGENFLNESAASLVCSTLQSCVTHNLVFDFSEAGALKLKNGDTILSSVSEVEVTPLKRKSTKREVHVKTMYGEGIFVHTMPATGDLPQRHKIRLSHGAMLYTTDDVTDMCSTDVFDDTSVDEQQMMFAPELSYDQAWIQLAVGAMTSMVVTLQLIESIGSLTIKFLSEWNVSHITILLSTLNSCHAHAHAFNHHSALRINLKLAGFMKFPDNAARLPHLLEQEISSLMKILDITTKLYNSANADIKSVVDVWFCRACQVSCSRYVGYDIACLVSSDKFTVEQLSGYTVPVLKTLNSLINLSPDSFKTNLPWVTPLLSSLIACNDRRVREQVRDIYEMHIDPFILNSASR